jgi:hypothetical protein
LQTASSFRTQGQRKLRAERGGSLREPVSSRRRRSTVTLPEAEWRRRLAPSAVTIALSLLALLGTSLVPLAAANAPKPDPYPVRAPRVVATPTPDPAPAATKPPTSDAASVEASKPVVAGSSVVSAATNGTSATTSSLRRRQEAPPTTKKKTRAESRPTTRIGPIGSRAAPGLAARPTSAPTAPTVAPDADGRPLLAPGLALLALILASGCLVQLLARSEAARART